MVSIRHSSKTITAARALLLALGMLIVIGGSAAQAGILYWDATPGDVSPVGGTGTWNLVDAKWRPNTWNGTPLQAWVNSNTAYFYDVPGTLTLETNIIVSQVFFQFDAYTIDGPFSLTVVGGVGSAASGAGAGTINVPVIMNLDVQFRNNITFNSNISDDGGDRQLQHYFDTLTLNASNSFTRGVWLRDASADLVIGHDHALGSGTLQVFDGSELEAGGGDRTVTNNFVGSYNGLLTLRGTNNLTFTAPTTLKANGGYPQFSVAETNTVLTFGSDLIQQVFIDGGMIKQGPGTFVIGGTYQADWETSVTGGVLILNGTTVAPLNNYGFTVYAGAALGGTGTINLAASGSTCTVQQAGALAPGSMSVGTLTVNGDVSLDENAVYKWEYEDGVGDLVDVNGTLTLPSVATTIVSQVSGALPSPAILFTANTLAGPGAADTSGWVVESDKSGYTVLIEGTDVILIPPPSGTVITIR